MDLSKLSKKEKIELLEAVKEKKRRIKNERPLYKPNPGQKEIHECRARERFVFSGNGFGKSCVLVQEAHAAAVGWNPWLKERTKVPTKVIVVLDSPEKVEQKFLPEFRKWFSTDNVKFHKKGKPYISQIEYDNGSTIDFMFFEMADLKFEGIDDIDFIGTDEPFPRRIYIGLSRGMREKGSQPRILLVGTPIASPWLRTEIYEPWSRGELSDVECYKFSNELNRDNLREGWLEEFANKLTDHEKEVRMEGAFFDSEGLALASLFRRDTHIVEPFQWPNGWPVVVSVDFHQSKPHTVCLLGADRDGNYYYIKEMTSRLPPIQFAEKLKEFYRGFRVKDVVCDSLGNTPHTGGDGRASFIEKMRMCGIPMRPTTRKDKDDEDWIQRIKHVLEIPLKPDNFGDRKPKLRIFRGNNGIIQNIENVSWTKHRNEDEFKPKLDIAQKDYLAALKYALAADVALMYSRPRIKRPKNRSPWSGQGKRSGVV